MGRIKKAPLLQACLRLRTSQDNRDQSHRLPGPEAPLTGDSCLPRERRKEESRSESLVTAQPISKGPTGHRNMRWQTWGLESGRGGGMARGPVSSLAWCCRAQPQRPCAHSGVLTRGAGSVGGCLAAGLSLLGSQPPACPLPTQSPPWPDTVRPLAVRPPCQAGSRLGRGSAASLPSARRGRMHRVRDGFSETFPPRPPSPDESARQEQSVSLLRSCLNGE